MDGEQLANGLLDGAADGSLDPLREALQQLPQLAAALKPVHEALRAEAMKD